MHIILVITIYLETNIINYSELWMGVLGDSHFPCISGDFGTHRTKMCFICLLCPVSICLSLLVKQKAQ